MAGVMQHNQELFTCSICLDLLKDPVTILCGHSYCMGCITDCWDQEIQKGVYSCPQCRETFSSRPVLKKNNIFAELVEQIRKTRIHTSATGFAGHGGVECDVCTVNKLKAVRSCLDCLQSYCEAHLETHNELHPGRKHSVIGATDLQERICSRHNKVFEIFCRTDQTCICYLCTMDEHKGHDIVTAAAEWINKQNQRKQTQTKFQQIIQEREKDLQELKKTVETVKSSAQTAVENCDRIFHEITCSIEKKRSEVTEMIRAKENAEVNLAEEVLKQLEQEIAELRRRDGELEQLSHADDHIHFLLNFQSVDPPQSQNISSITTKLNPSFEAVEKAVSTLKEQLSDCCRQELPMSTAAVAPVAVVAEPVTRNDFLQYYCHFTLDRDTVHENLHLSKRKRRVEGRKEVQSYPDHPDRFQGWHQVLCRECVSGRCYWEIEWSQKVLIAVSYKSISKEVGTENRFGNNDQSFCLLVNDSSSRSSFWHNNKQTQIPPVRNSRVGVYVDYSAGTLAFYSISDTMTLLLRVQTTFTDTLYPGFLVSEGSSVKLLGLQDR